jgi:hypothetical protein
MSVNFISWWAAQAGHFTQKSKTASASWVSATQIGPLSIVGVETRQSFRMCRKVRARLRRRSTGPLSRLPAVTGYLSSSSATP